MLVVLKICSYSKKLTFIQERVNQKAVQVKLFCKSQFTTWNCKMRKSFFQIIRAEPYWTANLNFTSHIAHRRIKIRLEFVGRTGVPPNGPPLVSTNFCPGPTNIFWEPLQQRSPPRTGGVSSK
jgi:hypothetical protein